MDDIDLARLVCFDDFHDAARTALTPDAYDYYRSGALREWTLAENQRAYERWTFVRRSMVDVSDIDTTTSVLGSDISFPVLIAPTAFHKLATPAGEVATALAAKAMGTVMVNSTLSTVPLEDVAATGAMRWFQLYVFTDRGLTRELVDRAMASGFTALVPTVDAPTIGIRYADQRNRFVLPDGMELANVSASLSGADGASGLRAFSQQFDQSLTWRDIEMAVWSGGCARGSQGRGHCRRRPHGPRGGRRRCGGVQPRRSTARRRPGHAGCAGRGGAGGGWRWSGAYGRRDS